jgi:5-methylcytosine-specific restriction endonuclease McrA
MRRRLLRVPYKGVTGRLDDPAVEHSHVLQYRIRLRNFWSLAKRGADRLALLRRYAEIRVPFRSGWTYQAMRSTCTAEGRRFQRCFVCRFEGPLLRHHILQVQNGGPNVTHNLVSLCARCHAKIHPWLGKGAQPRPQAPAMPAPPVFDARPRLRKREADLGS